MSRKKRYKEEKTREGKGREKGKGEAVGREEME